MKFWVPANQVFHAAKELYGSALIGGWCFEADPIDPPDMNGLFKKGDIVCFKGGLDRFRVFKAEDDDIVIEHPRTGRIFSVDYRALERAPASPEPPGCYYDYDMAEWSCVKGCRVHTQHGRKKPDEPVDDNAGPGEEDGPWAEGWDQRCGRRHD